MTINEDVLLKEVDEDLERDKQLEFFKKYGPLLGAAAAALIVAVGVFQFMGGAKQRAIAESAERYSAAVNEANADRLVAAEAMVQVATEVEGGYEILARMREANLLLSDGKKLEGLAALKAVYADESAPPRWQDLARIRAAMIEVDTNPSEAAIIAAGVSTDAFAPFAREVEGIAAMARQDYQTAYDRFYSLTVDTAVPPGLANRAQMMLPLADAGRKGVALEPQQTEAEAFIDAFSQQLEAEQEREAADPGDTP